MTTFRNFAVSILLILPVSPVSHADTLDEGIRDLQTSWAEITYHVIGSDRKQAGYEELEEQAERLEAAFPDRAEVKIWHGIVLSTHAGVSGGLGALMRVRKARSLFEEAIEIDGEALHGSAYTSLGSLYYKVPAWPLAFGNTDKAEQLLTHALKIDPEGIDANYFHADYLYEQGRYREAEKALEAALSAPDRPRRSLADAGRRQEVRVLLDKLRRQFADD